MDAGKSLSMERPGAMLDASIIPTLILGAIIGLVTAIVLGRRQNRRGDGR
jgi:hypothetical protein